MGPKTLHVIRIYTRADGAVILHCGKQGFVAIGRHGNHSSACRGLVNYNDEETHTLDVYEIPAPRKADFGLAGDVIAF